LALGSASDYALKSLSIVDATRRSGKAHRSFNTAEIAPPSSSPTE